MTGVAKKINHPEDVLDYFKDVEEFCRVMIDAYAVIDRHGKVIKSNQAFSQLTGKKSRQILKANSLDDLISFNIRDSRIPVQEILEYLSPTRIDEVRGDNGDNPAMNLIISIYPFISKEDASQSVGAFIMVRDVTAETNLQDKYKTTAIKSITDPLTGLFTRGYFEDFLNLQTGALMQTKADNEQRKLTLALLDIDFFKKVNDVYGHQAGDYVLKMVAGLCMKSFRKTDVCCRYGGEEFLVILPTTDIEGAQTAVEKFRDSVEKAEIIFDGKRIPTTISCGLAQIRIGIENYEQTIARADEALYFSKKAGRNRTSVHDGMSIAPATAIIS
jgi:diguanylate cyclase (GGDEF)-like protein/PAS domain S-box-containing protein